MRNIIIALLFSLSLPAAGAPPVPAEQDQAGGAACVMAKWQGNTLDYVLVHGKKHPLIAQEEGEKILREKGYSNYKANVDILHHQATSNLTHAYVIVVKTTYKTRRNRDRTSYGCGFSYAHFDHALQMALWDLQAFSWGWNNEKHGYEIVEQLRY
ncbi:MAG: hypothetical protein ABW162_15020 [Candidatus Sedimenticola sp. PURPLELP]